MQTLQQNSSNRINTPIKWNAPCLFYRPALPPGNSGGWRPVTWHLIIQGRWEIKLGRVDNILLRLSYLSWLLFIFLPAPSTTPQSVTINIQSLNLVFESLKVAQFKLKEKKKKTRGGRQDFLPYCTFTSSPFIWSKSHFYKSVGEEGSLPNSSYQSEDSAEAG